VLARTGSVRLKLCTTDTCMLQRHANGKLQQIMQCKLDIVTLEMCTPILRCMPLHSIHIITPRLILAQSGDTAPQSTHWGLACSIIAQQHSRSDAVAGSRVGAQLYMLDYYARLLQHQLHGMALPRVRHVYRKLLVSCSSNKRTALCLSSAARAPATTSSSI
jgi:hypothetical protein